MNELWQQREQWEEAEAKFCDQMVEDYHRMAREWWDKGLSAYAANAAQMAFECALRATVWQQMADHLRKAKRCRIEREQYDAPRQPNQERSS